ncbi:hypothetical protein LMH87_003058 [Akanthomyces muscarius]|uniref:Uncharacterized protein n=1 Tax=Akanthomyces muscarius TaxID=2231603 RepID=A0A9W8Q8X9_AKAMU|nr:hypothetical protein LMH87_003058 [Akanthomyces muscarius]KAJ4148594.1 hypothetical protein LMH87_003058 [Akanthomyces muscarius]
MTWTPATQTQYLPPVAGFTLRPTPALRVPRPGLVLRDDDDDDDDEDDDDRAGKITHGTATTTAGTAARSSGSSTSTPRPSNTCGWDKNGGGFYACSDSRSSCQYTNGVVGCCSGDNCRKIPKQCVAQTKECDSDDNGGTLCCHHSSAPACYTWLISTSTAGKQETYSLLGCTDKPGTGTLLPTDPASSSSSSSGGGGKTNIGAIVGGVIGGILALLGIALFAWYFMRQRRRGRQEHQAAAAAALSRQQRESGASWTEEGSEKHQQTAMYANSVPRRKEVPGTGEAALAAGACASPATTMTTTTDRAGTSSPSERHLAYSVSSASQTGSSSFGTAGVVSNLSTVPPPLEGVVEAPDTGLPPQESGAPVEAAS